MAESDDDRRLTEGARALKKECITAMARTEDVKKKIRTVSTEHPNEPWAAELVAKWQRHLDLYGVQYF